MYIDSCHNLQSLDQSVSKPSVRIELQVKQSDCQTTFVIENNSDPIFQQEFVFLIKNPYIDDLSIKVIDKDETVIARTIIRTSDIMAQPDMEYVCQPFQMKGEIGGNPVISLSANVRLETIQDFLIKLGIKPLMHPLEISIFSLSNDIVRLTKIMNNLFKDLKILSFKVIFQCLKLVESFQNIF